MKQKTILPSLKIVWDGKAINSPRLTDEGVFSEKNLEVSHTGLRTKVSTFVVGSKIVMVFGIVMLNGQPVQTSWWHAFVKNEMCSTTVAKLNGQFLIVIIEAKSGEEQITVINDRFNTFPIFWVNVKSGFKATLKYFDLVSLIKREDEFKFEPQNLFEFIWLNRLLLDKTYDNLSRYLLPANVLHVNSKSCKTITYWRPSFLKKKRSKDDLGHEFVDLLKKSVSRLTQDLGHRKIGHFLSGGHDSRVVLSAFEGQPSCISVAFSENLEIKVARKVAKNLNCAHHFIKLAPAHIVQNIDDAITLNGGMHSIFDPLFLGVSDKVEPLVDVVFHGHGIDYLFQGMYLPSKWVRFFGSPTFFKQKLEIKENFDDYFIHNISFRTKGVAIENYLLKEHKSLVVQKLKDSVCEVMRHGSDICSTKNDLWEYMTVHALGRHYSRSNIDSKWCNAEVRTPAFDNDLFDFYLSLPESVRLNGDVVKFALKKSRCSIGKIPTANWGFPAQAGPFEKTARLIIRKLIRIITNIQSFKAPELSDRTWPDREMYIRENADFRVLVLDAINSKELQSHLYMFDWPKLQKDMRAWLKNGNEKFGALAAQLVTLHRFLQLKQ